MNPTRKGRQEGRRQYLLVAALLLCAAIAGALGGWQIKRLAWKEALIAHVAGVMREAPVAAAVLPFAPTTETLEELEYRPVEAAGHFEPSATTLVSALTEEGAGYWVLAPLRLADGRVVWINRGFVPLGAKREALAAATPAGPVTLVGLLRKSEPAGRFLQPNQPAQERWYSRDIAAIAAQRGVQGSAAWFLDAKGDRAKGERGADQPIPGLTVVTFPNNHLQYALTWFALAGLCLFGVWLVMRRRD